MDAGGPPVANPVFVRANNSEEAWERTVDVVHDYLFEIERENKLGGVIETRYKTGASLMEPWHPDSVDHAPILASRLRIHSLSSGGLNKDDRPGDDVVVIQFVPLDADNEVLRVAGAVEFRLFDPQLPESDRELGHWTFSADECGRHWTRGIASSGFQFSLPLDQDPQHSDLIVKLTFQTPAGRNLELSQVVKVVSGLGTATKTRRVRMVPVHTVEESNDFLPPVGDSLETSDLSRDDLSNNVEGPAADSLPAASRSGHAVLHSSNWTDSTIPTIR